jgi:DNA primase
MNTQQSVLEIAQRYLRGAKKAGNDNLMAFCPFHDNVNTPAFTMSLSKGVWYCFSCHVKGNLRQFLTAMEVDPTTLRLTYGGLLDELRSQGPAPGHNPLQPGVVAQDPLDEAILGIFHECPVDLIDEGFTEETLLKFEVGFDRLHQRITFPIRDMEGNLVGISGRTVIDAYPRYKIYEDEYKDFEMLPRHLEKKYLWNAHLVYPEVFYKPRTRETYVVLVEGFKACMWLSQAGITNPMALLGSSMSEEQVWTLERLGAKVYIWLDNDLAGKSGCQKIGHRLSRSLDVYMVNYNEPQPSDVPLEEVPKLIQSAEDYHLWATREENRHVLR